MNTSPNYERMIHLASRISWSLVAQYSWHSYVHICLCMKFYLISNNVPISEIHFISVYSKGQTTRVHLKWPPLSTDCSIRFDHLTMKLIPQTIDVFTFDPEQTLHKVDFMVFIMEGKNHHDWCLGCRLNWLCTSQGRYSTAPQSPMDGWEDWCHGNFHEYAIYESRCE